MFVVVERSQLTFVVERVKCVGLILDVIDEHDAVDVIDLMLDDTSQKARSFKADFMAVGIEGADADFRMARNLAVNVRHAETPFVVVSDISLMLNDFRVNERHKFPVGLIVETAPDDDDPLESVDLDGRKGCADFMGTGIFPIKRGISHILDEQPNVTTYGLDAR